MIDVRPEDRNVLIFLWVDGIHENFCIKAYRQTRVTFGITSSPFLLGSTLLKHIDKYKDVYPDYVEKIRDSLYVDDLSTGELDATKAIELYKICKQVLSEGRFNLRKWKSNSKEVMNFIWSFEKIEKFEEETKILGLRWNTKKG